MKRARESPTTCKMFVGGLSQSTDSNRLVKYFEGRYAPHRVASAVVMYDNSTGRSRGFGFVTMDVGVVVDIIEAQRRDPRRGAACHALDGKTIEIKAATPLGASAPPVRSPRGGEPLRPPPPQSSELDDLLLRRAPPPAYGGDYGGGYGGGFGAPPPPPHGASGRRAAHGAAPGLQAWLGEQAVDAEAAALLRGSSSDVQLAVMGEGAVHGVNPSACLVSRVLRLKKLANAGALPRPQY
ncbi:RNA binding-protein [Aureococcus anophagefferens]|nr:RNA binding-protein [Aureococcus anophagefferens]